MNKIPKVVVVGGGTGTFVALTGLKKYPVELTAIVTMADSGGSNRVLRDEFGLLPTSDIRQCLVALAEHNGDSETLRKLFMYRFSKGEGISGMTFGNLFMAALAEIMGSQEKAIEETGKVLRIKGRIFPVTSDRVDLRAKYEDGRIVEGEHEIDEPRYDGKLRIVKLTTQPRARIDKHAAQALVEADFVVLGPGDLYTSVLANTVVGGFPQALKKTKGKVVYVVNLMTRWGQTYGFTAADHVAEVEKYIGKGILDTVFINSNLDFPKEALVAYREEYSVPVADDFQSRQIQAVRGDYASARIFTKPKGDKLARSMIRHDPGKLAKALYGYIRTAKA